MIRRFVLFVLALTLASAVATLRSFHVGAAEPAQRVAHLAFVGAGTPFTAPHGVAAFWARLRELGWVKNQNLLVEERWAEGQFDRLPTLMAEMLARKVDVLVTYGTPAAIAAKNTTSTVPIVVAIMGDPVGSGVAASLAHPGGNLTGLSQGWDEGIGGKWLELLQETVPRLSTIAVVANPDNPLARELARKLETIAPTRGLKAQLRGSSAHR
jgi:putative tryptophan/tyrosine transport system substrate-binding protein